MLQRPSRRPVPFAAATAARRLGVGLYRCQMLAYNLGDTVAQLASGCQGDLPQEHLDDYLRLRWLHWEQGRLRLAPDGAALCSAAA